MQKYLVFINYQFSHLQEAASSQEILDKYKRQPVSVHVLKVGQLGELTKDLAKLLDYSDDESVICFQVLKKTSGDSKGQFVAVLFDEDGKEIDRRSSHKTAEEDEDLFLSTLENWVLVEYKTRG